MKPAYLLLSALMFSPVTLANPAIDAFDNNEFDKAKSLFEQQAAENGHSIDSLYYLARIALNEDRLDDAEELLEEAIDKGANESEHHYWFGVINGQQAMHASIFSQMGYASTSLEHFEKAVELDGDSVQALRGLTSYLINAPSIAGGDIDEAKKLAAHIQTLDKLEGLQVWANIYRAEEDTEQAITIAKQLQQEHGDSIRGLLTAGFIFQTSEDFESAFQAFAQAITLPVADEDDRSNHLSAKYQLGRNAVFSDLFIEEGITALQDYLKQDDIEDAGTPNKQWASLRLAKLYVKQEKHDKARELAEQVLDDPIDDDVEDEAEEVLKSI